MSRAFAVALITALGSCFGHACGGDAGDRARGGGEAAPNESPESGAPRTASLPLTLVSDVDLPGKANRFDYQDVDVAEGHLVLAHMNDASVVIVDRKDGAVVKVLPNIATPRGVIVADEAARIFVTSAPDQLVLIDNHALTEVGRVKTGRSPDGVAWDPVHRIVAVSDQGDGAVSLLSDAGTGARVQTPLGSETGNVVFDPTRSTFWITVVGPGATDRLVAIDPASGKATTTIDLPGCKGAHGLRIHPDGASALVACEGNDVLARVELEGAHALVTAKTGSGPDVLAIDPGLGWLYVAAESGDLTVFDIARAGLVAIDREHPGDAAHSVAVDVATHRVFFPLAVGPKGNPVLRVMRPSP
jgi:DNA-binding beta-propeller fold protein YncE